MGFWNKVGNAVVTVIEIVPEILGAIQQEGAKKADSRVKDYESQVDQAENFLPGRRRPRASSWSTMTGTATPSPAPRGPRVQTRFFASWWPRPSAAMRRHGPPRWSKSTSTARPSSGCAISTSSFGIRANPTAAARTPSRP